MSHLYDMQVDKFGKDFVDSRKANEWLSDKIFKEYDSIPYVNDVENPGNISYMLPPKNIMHRIDGIGGSGGR